VVVAARGDAQKHTSRCARRPRSLPRRPEHARSYGTAAAQRVKFVVGRVGSERELCLTSCLELETLISVKEVVMEAHARTAIRSFSKSAKMELGKYIFQLQHGQTLTMPASRPMPSIALGASELRVKDSAGIYRVFYYLKVKGKILIFHAFTKKTEKTPGNEISVAKERLKRLLEEVRENE
jgi:phage-related protein